MIYLKRFSHIVRPEDIVDEELVDKKTRLKRSLTAGALSGTVGAGMGAFAGYGMGEGKKSSILGGAALGSVILGIPTALATYFGDSDSAIKARNIDKEKYREFLRNPEPIMRKSYEIMKRDAYKIEYGGPGREMIKLIDLEISFIPTMLKWYNKTHDLDCLGDLLPIPIKAYKINEGLDKFKNGDIFGINILKMNKFSEEYLSWFPDSDRPYGFMLDDVNGDYRSIKGALTSYYIGRNDPLVREFSKQLRARL